MTERDMCHTNRVSRLPNVRGRTPRVPPDTSSQKKKKKNWDETRILILVIELFPISADAFDNDLVLQTLQDILQGKTVQIPVYDFVTHSR